MTDTIYVGVPLTAPDSSGMDAARVSPRVSQLGYDAANLTSKRRAPLATLRSEDDELGPASRRRLQSTASDLQRNFEIAAWAIRKHLDFVTSFTFSANNAEQAIANSADADMRSMLDDDLEGLIAEASQPEQCDAAARHDLAMHLRLAESRATITGDHAWLELEDGTLQAIESDRIRTPDRDAGGNVVHGVRLDPRGRALAYAVHHRAGRGYVLDRWVPASAVAMRGYYDRTDQVRGISPLAPALNRLRDVYEGFDYALAKAKIAQLFGFKIKRSGDDPLGNVTNSGSEARPDYAIDLNAGPWLLDLEPGDEAEIMETATPADQFVNYSELMIAVSMLALDLPWNFFKVDATNFFGSRAALNLYLQSVKPKRRANMVMLQRWTRRQLQRAILSGRLRLPRSMTVDDLRWAWTPDGLPWWNPSQEADGALKSIAAGLDNPQRICQETGTNFFSNVDRIAEAQAYATARGVQLQFAVAAPPASQQQDE